MHQTRAWDEAIFRGVNFAMDRLRREAERSGDSLNFALELRRGGEDLRAKRLLQELGWDNDDALTVLDELYPLWPEHEQILGRVKEKHSGWRIMVCHIVGSPDPRINHRLRETTQRRNSRDSESSRRNVLDDSLKLLDCRAQMRRLKSEEFWFERLEWAEPLPEEMSAFMDWLDRRTNGNRREWFDEYGRVRLGWALFRWGFGDLLRRWLKTFNPVRWRERTLLERLEKTLTATLVPEGQAVPSWVQPRLLPRYRDTGEAALPETPYIQNSLREGEWATPTKYLKERFHRGHVLYLSFPKRLHSNRDQIWSKRGLRLRSELVSSWQELLGDRVISTERKQDYVIIWEFGQLKTVLESLISAFNAVFSEPYEHAGELRIGVASVTTDLQASLNLAKLRSENAFQQSVSYLPECLTD